ncbi:uncharacterized protein CCOS01_02985 [Colletotrichum costaricense]|uniref:Uncharacterized protein n=1 Tax=Colletotrichum costaricense TaxID=1209916 RepID=A0AAJ0E597_9PEZI|nr:uncharacterized protein CCOS01_02985 [Colletotrichum costaricense]KAK1534233.1 hypothetical protein CCOS01_02985 [Colletotrichum costaricense]
MMDYSSITCFLSIPATLSAHPYPFLQRVLAGGVTFIRQTGPTNDSSNSRHYQGSGIVRYGGAWRGSLFPWFPARKKSQLRHLIPGPCSSLLACPSLHHFRSYPPVTAAAPGPIPPSTHLLPPIARFARFARSHTSHTLPLPPPCNICPWRRGTVVHSKFSGVFFYTRHATRFKQLIRTPHHSSRAKAPTAPPPPPPIPPSPTRP